MLILTKELPIFVMAERDDWPSFSGKEKGRLGGAALFLQRLRGVGYIPEPWMLAFQPASIAFTALSGSGT